MTGSAVVFCCAGPVLAAEDAGTISAGVAWHGRLMVLAWSILIPLGVFMARFGKVLPGQDWPRECDNRVWWRTHLIVQSGAGLAAIAALVLILSAAPDSERTSQLHRVLGWTTLALLTVQLLSGVFRGSKGGPTDHRGERGDHYDMTRRRRVFEALHKGVGYLALLLAFVTTFAGLHAALAPLWMVAVLAFWWSALVLAFILLEQRVPKISTYQAIWGPGAEHPGNRR